MPLQHHLSATYLAFFSTDNTPRRRERVISFGDRTNGNIRETKTSAICGIHNFYEINLENLNLSIDESWAYYESDA